MLSNLNVIQNNYVKNFPAEVPVKAAQGFVVTAIIKLLVGSAGNVALAGGALAAAATGIEAVTRPIIKGVFPENPEIAKCIQIFIPKMLTLGLASAIAPGISLGYKMTSILFSLIAWAAFNNRFYDRNEGIVEVL